MIVELRIELTFALPTSEWSPPDHTDPPRWAFEERSPSNAYRFYI